MVLMVEQIGTLSKEIEILKMKQMITVELKVQ